MKRKKREEKRKRKGEWKEGEKKEYEIGGGDSWDGLTGFHRFPSLNFFVRARHDSTFARRANSKARALSTMQLYRRSTWASTPVISGMIQLSRKRLVDSRHEKRFPSLSLLRSNLCRGRGNGRQFSTVKRTTLLFFSFLLSSLLPLQLRSFESPSKLSASYMIHLDQDANKMLEARKKSGRKRKKGTERTQAVSKIGLATRNNVVEVAVVGY